MFRPFVTWGNVTSVYYLHGQGIKECEIDRAEAYEEIEEHAREIRLFNDNTCWRGDSYFSATVAPAGDTVIGYITYSDIDKNGEAADAGYILRRTEKVVKKLAELVPISVRGNRNVFQIAAIRECTFGRRAGNEFYTAEFVTDGHGNLIEDVCVYRAWEADRKRREELARVEANGLKSIAQALCEAPKRYYEGV